DYPIEQYLRDAKIDSLYEGTTAIQSLDLLFRKIVRDQGRAWGRVTAEIQAFSDAPDSSATAGGGQLKEERVLLATALAEVQVMLGAMFRHLSAAATEPDSVYKVGQYSVRLLLAVGDLLVGWLLLRQADVALAALDGPVRTRDQAFYLGKVGAARFFATTVLPRLSADRAIIEATDNALMDLPEEAF
ncbi:MAG TPA: acyl-CoA dehydrogenase, partial [Pseudonocardia sp.]|nr:acyl-CoA dehydrogenase [Pseudonocardia sp.]